MTVLSLRTLTLNLSDKVWKRLDHTAHHHRMTVDQVVAHFINSGFNRKKKRNLGAWVDKGRKEGGEESGPADVLALREIIRRQDAEIEWLREEVMHLIGLTSSIHAIHHDIETCAGQTNQNNSQEKLILSPLVGSEEPVIVTHGDPSPAPQVDFDDEKCAGAIESSAEPIEFLSPVSDGSGSEGSEKGSGRALRNMVGGVKEEKRYTLTEAAAIAGEPEATLLEYINNGLLPAQIHDDIYLIHGNDLRRYMLSE